MPPDRWRLRTARVRRPCRKWRSHRPGRPRIRARPREPRNSKSSCVPPVTPWVAPTSVSRSSARSVTRCRRNWPTSAPTAIAWHDGSTAWSGSCNRSRRRTSGPRRSSRRHVRKWGDCATRCRPKRRKRWRQPIAPTLRHGPNETPGRSPPAKLRPPNLSPYRSRATHRRTPRASRDRARAPSKRHPPETALSRAARSSAPKVRRRATRRIRRPAGWCRPARRRRMRPRRRPPHPRCPEIDLPL